MHTTHTHERTHTRTQHTRARANTTALSALSCHAHAAEDARLSITTPRTTRPLAPTLTLVHSHSMSRHARPQTHTQHTSTCANSLLVQHTRRKTPASPLFTIPTLTRIGRHQHTRSRANAHSCFSLVHNTHHHDTPSHKQQTRHTITQTTNTPTHSPSSTHTRTCIQFRHTPMRSTPASEDVRHATC